MMGAAAQTMMRKERKLQLCLSYCFLVLVMQSDGAAGGNAERNAEEANRRGRRTADLG